MENSNTCKNAPKELVHVICISGENVKVIVKEKSEVLEDIDKAGDKKKVQGKYIIYADIDSSISVSSYSKAIVLEDDVKNKHDN